MPEETTTVETTNDQHSGVAGEKPADNESQDTPQIDGEFDAERAMHTIETLRTEIKGLKRESKALKKAEQDAANAAKAAEEERLAEQEKWQDLAEKRKERLLELEPKAAELETAQAEIERLKEALQSNVNAQFEGIPDHVTDLLQHLDPVEQMQWLSENREKFVKASGIKGVNATPKANGTAALTHEEKLAKAAIPGRDY